MRTRFLLAAAMPLFAATAMVAGQLAAKEPVPSASKVQIPASVQAEHKEIHSALVAATRAPGRVGAAAKALAQVLDPHFKREEQIALPPLGLLRPLASGERPAEINEVLAMTDSLKQELPRMLEEHKRIRSAVEKFRLAARAERAAKYERLAEQLALHAQTEEEVFYPAAIVVGDLIRARYPNK